MVNEGWFKKGFIPWNKNKKGYMGANKTSFKEGITPWNKGLHIPLRHNASFKKGYIPWNKGKSHEAIKGVLHPLWIVNRNQLRKSEKKHLDGKYRDWMFAVKKRDGWKCRVSNSYCKGRLESHHILNWIDYPELRYEINNGITLCHAHHPRGREREAELSPYLQSLVAEMK